MAMSFYGVISAIVRLSKEFWFSGVCDGVAEANLDCWDARR